MDQINPYTAVAAAAAVSQPHNKTKQIVTDEQQDDVKKRKQILQCEQKTQQQLRGEEEEEDEENLQIAKKLISQERQTIRVQKEEELNLQTRTKHIKQELQIFKDKKKPIKKVRKVFQQLKDIIDPGANQHVSPQIFEHIINSHLTRQNKFGYYIGKPDPNDRKRIIKESFSIQNRIVQYLRKTGLKWDINKNKFYQEYLGFDFIYIPGLQRLNDLQFFQFIYGEEKPRYWNSLQSLHDLAIKKLSEISYLITKDIDSMSEEHSQSEIKLNLQSQDLDTQMIQEQQGEQNSPSIVSQNEDGLESQNLPSFLCFSSQQDFNLNQDFQNNLLQQQLQENYDLSELNTNFNANC